jgi:hypothetical protein
MDRAGDGRDGRLDHTEALRFAVVREASALLLARGPRIQIGLLGGVGGAAAVSLCRARRGNRHRLDGPAILRTQTPIDDRAELYAADLQCAGVCHERGGYRLRARGNSRTCCSARQSLRRWHSLQHFYRSRQMPPLKSTARSLPRKSHRSAPSSRRFASAHFWGSACSQKVRPQ